MKYERSMAQNKKRNENCKTLGQNVMKKMTYVISKRFNKFVHHLYTCRNYDLKSQKST